MDTQEGTCLQKKKKKKVQNVVAFDIFFVDFNNLTVVIESDCTAHSKYHNENE